LMDVPMAPSKITGVFVLAINEEREAFTAYTSCMKKNGRNLMQNHKRLMITA